MNTTAAFRCQRIARQDGVAAVELAILAAVIFWFLASALFIARSVMQATLVQRAANNAAHMIANYPQYLRSDASVDLDGEVGAMATEELLQGGIPASAIGGAGSDCGLSCTAKQPPAAVGAVIFANVMDPANVLPSLNTLTIKATSSDRYAN